MLLVNRGLVRYVDIWTTVSVRECTWLHSTSALFHQVDHECELWAALRWIHRRWGEAGVVSRKLSSWSGVPSAEARVRGENVKLAERYSEQER